MGEQGWDGDLYIGNSFALFCGRTADTELHHHYAAQCAFAEDGEVELERANGEVIRAMSVFIPSEEIHRLRATKATIRILFYEPAMARSKPPEDIAYELSAHNWLERDWPALFSLPDALDPRVRKALDLLDLEADDFSNATVLARAVGLSRNRFMTLFTAEIGVPVRRYILWRRLKTAAAAIAEGANITVAAHASGFADSAHFARTMKSMFGVTATDSVQRLNIVLL
ncbi:helix-turn-helix domain-containing protein [Hyphococcus sp.]|uniref:helix-turn-helix transcriptional regulator n=1 Tax=Hyphococcus sp. TaxID=2038636 RepID=UPI003D0C7E64